MNYADEMRSLYEVIKYADWERGAPYMEQALALATDAQDEDAIYELNLALFVAKNSVGDTPAALAAFDAVAERRMADPVRFPEKITKPTPIDLGYQATLVLECVGVNASVGREQIEHTLSSLSQLAELSGTAELNVPREKLVAAIYLGDVDSWRTLATELQTQPMDTVAQCEACTQHDLAHAYRRIDGTDAGLAVVERMLREDIACPIEPETTLSMLLVPALLNGNSAFVSRHFARVNDLRLPYCEERLALRTPLLALAALTENVALGLELFESLLPDLALVLHQDVARMEFFANAALLLDRATARGLGQRSVRDTVGVLPAQGLGEQSETVATLAPKLWATAEKLAARFDAGRGNTFRRDQIAEIRSWATASIPLPLGEAPAEPFTFEPPRQPQNGTGWAAWAKERATLPDRPATLDACDRALADTDLDPSLRSDMLAYRLRARAELAQVEAGVTTVDELDPQVRDELADEFSELMASMAASGKPTHAAILTALGLARYDIEFNPDPDYLSALLEQFSEASPSDRGFLESHLACAWADAGDSEQAAKWAILSGEHSESDPDPEIRDSGRLFTGHMLTLLGHPEARSWLERLIADCDESPVTRAHGHMALSRLHANSDEHALSATHAQRASYLYASVDAPRWAADASSTQAALLESANDLAGAIQATRRVLELSNLVEGYDQLPVSLELGRLLGGAGQAEQALAVLQQVDSELAARGLLGSPDSYACAYWLGHTRVALDQPQEAADLWQAALNLASSESGAPDQVPLFARALGNLLATHQQWDAALEAFETMRGIAQASEDPLMEIGLNERVGLITCSKGDPSGLDALIHARARAEELNARWAAADITDSLARAFESLGRIDESVAAALDASDRFVAEGDHQNGHDSFTLAVFCLARAERFTEAIALLEPIASENEEYTSILANLRDRE